MTTSRARAEPVGTALRLDDPGLKIRMQFSSANPDDLPADAFRGPAVAHLPTIR